MIVFGDLSCYDCINNPQDPTAKLQIKMGMNFPLDAPQSRHDIAEKIAELAQSNNHSLTHSLVWNPGVIFEISHSFFIYLSILQYRLHKRIGR